MAQDLSAPLKVYFYHTRPTDGGFAEWKQKRFPGHLLYGMPLLDKHGITCVMHPFRFISERWKLTLDTTWKILTCRKAYDVLYATSFRGIELIVFLRALGLYRKPIVIWHHQAIIRSSKTWRERLSRFFYKGFDYMFFFSEELIRRSREACKFDPAKMKLVHWGPDLDFYDRILGEEKQQNPSGERHGYISTGKENRDLVTLIKAFARTKEELDIYIAKTCGSLHYDRIVSQLDIPEHVHIHFTEGIIPYELALKVARKQFIVICCLDAPYTVGLTTLVEALALGMPVLCSKNPTFGFDIDREKVGMTIPYDDVEGWQKAIDWMAAHPQEAEQMGRNARKLAEERFNLEIFSKEIADALHEVANKRRGASTPETK